MGWRAVGLLEVTKLLVLDLNYDIHSETTPYSSRQTYIFRAFTMSWDCGDERLVTPTNFLVYDNELERLGRIGWLIQPQHRILLNLVSTFQ